MHFNLQPTLENELVLLRPLEEKDYEPLYLVAKDPLIWEQHPCRDRYQREVYHSFFKDSLDSKGALLVVHKRNGEVIGSSRYKRISGVSSVIEIGWSFLARKYWGGKYNRSVKALMMEHAFEYVEDIIFYVGNKNVRSQRAVEKIGGVRITQHTYPQVLAKNRDDYTYQINKGTWKQNQ